MDYVIWDNTLRQWILFAVIVAATWIVVRILRYASRRWLQPLVERTQNRADNIIYGAVEAPLRFGVALLGLWIAIHVLVYPDSWVRYVDMSFRMLIVLDITWLVARLAVEAVQFYWHRRSDDESLRLMPVVRRAILIVVWLLGAVTALSNVGVDISALWGTLGIGGIALALAAQDTVKNILGAITIFTDRPFVIGDTINIGGYEGTVVDIGMRSTRLRGYDGRITSYPNYRITEAAILNITSEPMRRVEVRLRPNVDTPPEKVERVMDLLASLPKSIRQMSQRRGDTAVYFTELGEQAFVVLLQYRIARGGDIMRTTSDVNLRIISDLQAEGLSLAAPSQRIFIETDADTIEDAVL